jgi:multidrug efflux pump subunit AcrB
MRQRLLRIPGVGQTDILGEQPARIFVEFSTQRLATLGVSQTQLFAALAGQNALVPAGAVETRGASVFVRAGGSFDSVDMVAATPIAAGGRVLRLGDIATVRRGYEDPPIYVVRHNGAPPSSWAW